MIGILAVKPDSSVRLQDTENFPKRSRLVSYPVENAVQIDDVETIVLEFRQILGAGYARFKICYGFGSGDFNAQRQGINADDISRGTNQTCDIGGKTSRSRTNVEHALALRNVQGFDQLFAMLELVSAYLVIGCRELGRILG
jgi:hypothetical protein